MSRGVQKPPFGVYQVNPSHPFSRGLLLTMLFDGHHRLDLFSNPVDTTIFNGAVARSITTGGTPVWGSNVEGTCLHQPSAAAGGVGSVQMGAEFLSSAVTLCVIWQKLLPSTFTTQYLFSTSAAGATNCSTHCPWADGNVYWDFAGARLTVSGLTFSAFKPDRWVFTGGPLGMQLWQNGVKVGSSGTPQTRTITPANTFALWPTYGPEPFKMNYFAAYDHQWDEGLCRAWSIEPYAHLYPSSQPYAAFNALSAALSVVLSDSITVSDPVTRRVITALKLALSDAVTLTDPFSHRDILNTRATVSDTVTTTEASELQLQSTIMRLASEGVSVADVVKAVQTPAVLRLLERIGVRESARQLVSQLTAHLIDHVQVRDAALHPNGAGGVSPEPPPVATVADYWTVGV